MRKNGTQIDTQTRNPAMWPCAVCDINLAWPNGRVGKDPRTRRPRDTSYQTLLASLFFCKHGHRVGRQMQPKREKVACYAASDFKPQTRPVSPQIDVIEASDPQNRVFFDIYTFEPPLPLPGLGLTLTGGSLVGSLTGQGRVSFPSY
jgi:hypothetical protein